MAATFTTPIDRWTRRLAFALGLSLVALALVAWRVPRAQSSLGADVYLSASSTGELSLEPMGLVLTANDVRPSAPPFPHRRLTVRNQTGTSLDVRVRVTRDGPGLDGLLWVELTSDDHHLFKGTLGQLRGWTARLWVLPSGQSRPLEIRIWIPSGMASGYEGRIVSAELEFRSTAVGG